MTGDPHRHIHRGSFIAGAPTIWIEGYSMKIHDTFNFIYLLKMIWLLILWSRPWGGAYSKTFHIVASHSLNKSNAEARAKNLVNITYKYNNNKKQWTMKFHVNIIT